MPRPGRIAVEGGVYHVYNRLGRGERVFDDDDVAAAFVELLREVVGRDSLTVFAWCLMSNHYHLAVQTSTITLDRPMRSLQQRTTRLVNGRRRVYGPLWQGRYKAKLVEGQRYLDQLLVYIHLNPVSAGVVSDPVDYRWCGHREIVQRAKLPIVAVDEVLRLFGSTRRTARARYVRALKGAVNEEWIGESPGRLPWWRLGRPPRGEDEDPEIAVRERRRWEREGPEWRPRLSAPEMVVRGALELGVDLESLRSRGRSPDVVRARELLAVVGVERYGLLVRDLADALKKSPNGISDTLARGVRLRTEDEPFRRELDGLDRAIAGGVEKAGGA